MKIKKISMIIILFLSLMMPQVSFSDPSKFSIKIDPKLELLSVIQSLTSWPKIGAFTGLRHSYYNRVNQYFGKFKDHPAVKWYEENLLKGWSYDAPPKGMLHLSNLPEMKIESPFTEELIKRGRGLKNLKKMVNLMNQFVKDTSFMKFWNENQSFYKTFYSKLKNLIPYEKYVGLMEKYYGEKSDEFIFVPVILFHGGGYGARMIGSKGKKSYYFGGPHKMDGDIPVFKEKNIRRLVFHEFGHSFVNPIVDQFREQLSKYGHFFKYIEKSMRSQAYSSWQTSMYEHFVRLGEDVLLGMAGFEEERKENFNHNLDRRFLLLPFIKEKVQKYLKNQKKYGSLRKFFPEFFEVFEQIKPVFEKKIPGDMGVGMKINSKGCTFTRFFENNPFEKSGAKVGDVWYKINNIVVTGNTYFQVMDLWGKSKPGETFDIVLKRKDKEIKCVLKVPFTDQYTLVEK